MPISHILLPLLLASAACPPQGLPSSWLDPLHDRCLAALAAQHREASAVQPLVAMDVRAWSQGMEQVGGGALGRLAVQQQPLCRRPAAPPVACMQVCHVAQQRNSSSATDPLWHSKQRLLEALLQLAHRQCKVVHGKAARARRLSLGGAAAGGGGGGAMAANDTAAAAAEQLEQQAQQAQRALIRELAVASVDQIASLAARQQLAAALPLAEHFGQVRAGWSRRWAMCWRQLERV